MKVQDIIRKKPYLIWYTKNYDGLSEEAVVEAVLSGGDWEDVEKLFNILGIDHAADIFYRQIKLPRCNYSDRIINYFNLYFAAHAPRSTH